MALTAEQLIIRRTGLGSSDIAAVCGEDPFRGPLDVWLDKTGRSTPTFDTVNTRMGNRLEEVIACEFADRHNVTIETCTTEKHPDLDWVVATVDRRIIGRPEVLECKSVGHRMRAKWWNPAANDYEAPPYVNLQALWQCLVTGDEAYWIAAWIGGRDWYDHRFSFDGELAGHVLEIGERFWRDCVIGGRQPAPDHTKRSREILGRLYPRSRPIAMPEPPPEVVAMAKQYAAARAAEAAAKKAKEMAGNNLRSLLGEYERAEGEWGRVTWKSGTKGKTNWGAVAKKLGASPPLVAACTSTPTRTLNVEVVGLEEDETEEGAGDE